MDYLDKEKFKAILQIIMLPLIGITLGTLLVIGMYHLVNHYIDIPAIIETFIETFKR